MARLVNMLVWVMAAGCLLWEPVRKLAGARDEAPSGARLARTIAALALSALAILLSRWV